MSERGRGGGSSGGRRPSAFRLGVLSLTGVLSLLIWQRLRLVTDTPRSVYAEPRRDEEPRARSPEDEPPEGERPVVAAD
ncbi:MAG: hypothetical protein KJZ54_06200 [Phycisphaerales bacterium]|nr:hypothetical protein [Phycisphaerales bacterium]